MVSFGEPSIDEPVKMIEVSSYVIIEGLKNLQEIVSSNNVNRNILSSDVRKFEV